MASARRTAAGIVLMVCVVTSVRATTYYVKPDGNDNGNGLSWASAFKTIQKGVNSGSNDDVVEVNEGTYYEAVIINNVNCTVTSPNPNNWDVVAATIINGDGATNTVVFDTNSSGALKGFTITGSSWYGINCYIGSRPVISGCIITGNEDGVVAMDDSSPVIENCKIFGNVSSGIYLIRNSAGSTVRNNWIYKNGSYGIRLLSPKGAAIIRNNTIVGHKKYGIVEDLPGVVAKITNCIIWDNNDDLSSRCSATYSCIEDGNSGAGNISLDPRFVNRNNNDFHVQWNSPCFNRGDPNYSASSGETDIDGEQRVIGGRVEIGADELNLFPNKIMHHDGVSDYGYDRLQTRERLQYLSPNVVWTIGRRDDNADKMREMISRLRIINPKTKLCSYLSSCQTQDYKDRNDPCVIHYKTIAANNWFLRDAGGNIVWSDFANKFAFINMTDANARAAVIDVSIKKAKKWGLDALSFDNCYWSKTPCPETVPLEVWRKAFLDFYKEAKTRADTYGLGLYVNVVIHAGDIPDALAAIGPDVNGIILEMPFPINCRTDYYVAEELNAYKDFISKGKDVLLYHQFGDANQQLMRGRWILSKIRPLAEQYGTIYFGALSPWAYPEPLLTYNTNLVTNGNFNNWTVSGDPCNWQVSGTNGIKQVGYVQKTLLWNQTYLVPLQDHKGWWRNKSGLHRDPNYGIGACNLYTTGKSLSISQSITTAAGETYRFSIFIGQTDPVDPNNYNITGSIKVSVSDGTTTLAEHTYHSASVKTFDFEASSTTTTIKIENANLGKTTDVTFDDVAIWLVKK